jgi:hypothetical protein
MSKRQYLSSFPNGGISGLGYIKLRDVFNPHAKQRRDKPFQQVGILHKHHLEQYVVRQLIFKRRHRVIPYTLI